MRILVYEYLSTGALTGQPGAESLAREGLAMLGAVLADLAACTGVEVTTLVAPNLVARVRALVPAAEILPLAFEDEEPTFRQQARRADGVLVIAPEFDDLLARRSEWVLEEGSQLLGSSPLAIRLTGDKFRLAAHLRAHHVPTPITALYEPGERPCEFPVIVKPRHGAGAQATYFTSLPKVYDTLGERARAEGWTGQLIVQPLLGSIHLPAPSVAFLVGPAGRVALLPGEQTLETQGVQLRYAGGRFPLSRKTDVQALVALAGRAIDLVPGLRGYVGVDLATWRTDDQSDHGIIEINPRLTTSYVGLRRLARFNVVQVLLDVLAGKSPAVLDYDSRAIRFTPDGSIT